MGANGQNCNFQMYSQTGRQPPHRTGSTQDSLGTSSHEREFIFFVVVHGVVAASSLLLKVPVVLTRTAKKCTKTRNAPAVRAKLLLFLIKYADLWCFHFLRRRRSYVSLLLEVHDDRNGDAKNQRV